MYVRSDIKMGSENIDGHINKKTYALKKAKVVLEGDLTDDPSSK